MRIFFYRFAVAGYGGVEKILKIIDAKLDSFGHETTFIFSEKAYDNEKWAEDFVGEVLYSQRNLYGIPPRLTNEFFFFAKILDLQKTLMKSTKPDVFIAVGTAEVMVARIALGVYGSERPPLISWNHAIMRSDIEYLQTYFADGHLAISTGVANQIRKISRDNPVEIIYNPVPHENYRIISRSNIPTFLYMGRLDKDKRIDVLLNGFSAVRDQQFRLKIYGKVVVEDKSFFDEIIKNAIDSGINDKIDWMGWEENPWDSIIDATALLLTSDFEAFPGAILEALAHGIPVISSRSIGPEDSIQHGVNGWLFPIGDSAALGTILQQIIEDPSILPVAENCQQSARKFHEDIVVNHMIDALEHYKLHLN